MHGRETEMAWWRETGGTGARQALVLGVRCADRGAGADRSVADAGVLPVAERWYQATTADDTVTMIREPHAHPFLRANIWHVRGRDRDLVIDCGLGVTPLRPAFPGLFTHDPVLVLTHSHLDHMGAAGEFEQCLAHKDEPAERPPAQTLLGRQLAATFRLDQPLPQVLLTALPHRGYDPASYRLRPARVSAWVREGDIVDLGDRAFTVLHLPGHSPGSIALFDEHDGTLFAGDVVYDGPLLDELPGSCRSDYLTSMSRLRDLPVRIVHAGHDASFDRTRLHQLIDAYVASHAVSPAPLAGRANRPRDGGQGKGAH